MRGARKGRMGRSCDGHCSRCRIEQRRMKHDQVSSPLEMADHVRSWMLLYIFWTTEDDPAEILIYYYSIVCVPVNTPKHTSCNPKIDNA